MMEMSKTLYVSPYSVARVHTGLGDKEQALDWLEKACEQRHGILAYLKVEPVFDPLRSEPRFIGLLRKMGLSE
jgi:serine/threonine-protein kinase